MVALTLDTAVDKGRKEMADRVARFAARQCSRDGNLCYYCCLKFSIVFVFWPYLLSFAFSCSPSPSFLSFFLRLGVASLMKQVYVPLQHVHMYLLFLQPFLSASCCVIRIMLQFKIPFGFILFFTYVL